MDIVTPVLGTNESRIGGSVLDRLIRTGPNGLFFFISAALVFSSFLLQGEVILATTDNFFNHYPNLLFGYRAVHEGHFGLWNPYIFAGVDFTTSMHHHILHPIHWIVLPFPEKYIFHVLTFRVFLEVALIGCIVYKIFLHYVLDRWAALFLAIVVQLGGYTWFSVTSLIGTHMLFACVLAIYLILTWERRRRLTTFVYLSFLFADILLMAHVGYIFAFGFPILVMAAAKSRPDGLRRPWRGVTPVVVAAGIMGIGMAAYRLWPVLHGLLYEQEQVSKLWLPNLAGNTGYLALTGLIPEAWGIHLGEAADLSQLLHNDARHIGLHNLLYFGIMPTMLVSMALARSFGTQAFCLAILWALVANASVYLIQPLADIFNVLFYPIIHDVVPRTFTPFLFIGTLMFATRAIQDTSQNANYEPQLRGFLALAGVVLAVEIAFSVKILHELLPNNYPRAWPWVFLALRVLLLGLLAVFIVMVFRASLTTEKARRASNVSIGCFAIVATIMGIISLWRGSFWNEWMVLRGFAYVVGAALWAVCMVRWARVANDPSWQFSTRHRVLLFTLVGVFSVLLFLIPEQIGHPRPTSAIAYASVLGTFKFIVLVFVSVEMVIRWQERKLSRAQFFVLLTLFTFGDLLFFTKFNSHVGASPFVEAKSLYPEHDIPSIWAERATWKTPLEGDQKNLLHNANFNLTKGEAIEWAHGGTETSFSPMFRVPGALRVDVKGDSGTLFQDVVLEESGKTATLGAWVRTDQKKVSLLLASLDKGKSSVFHSGSGKWEWLSVTFHSAEKIRKLRAHVVLEGRGSFNVYAPRLVASPVLAVASPPNGEVTKPASSSVATEEMLPDFAHYRANNANRVVDLHESTYSNIPMVYRIPTYGGVDSDVKNGLLSVITAFESPNVPWIGRIGIVATATNPRLLDILGVRYELSDPTRVGIRPNALARLSVFRRYEAMDDASAALKRLRDQSFDPATTVILDKSLDWKPDLSGLPSRFEPIPYLSSSSSRLEADLALSKPAVLLFNDSYSPYWQARFNGERLPVMKANGNFMAVSLPARAGHLVLEFIPHVFLILCRMSASIAALIFGVGVFLLFSKPRSEESKEHGLR